MLTTIFFCLLSAASAVVLLRVAQRWGKPTPENWACASEIAQALRDASFARQRYQSNAEHDSKQKATQYFSRLCAEIGAVDALKLVLQVGLAGELLSGPGPEAVIREMASLLGVTEEVFRQARSSGTAAASQRVILARR